MNNKRSAHSDKSSACPVSITLRPGEDWILKELGRINGVLQPIQSRWTVLGPNIYSWAVLTSITILSLAGCGAQLVRQPNIVPKLEEARWTKVTASQENAIHSIDLDAVYREGTKVLVTRKVERPVPTEYGETMDIDYLVIDCKSGAYDITPLATYDANGKLIYHVAKLKTLKMAPAAPDSVGLVVNQAACTLPASR